MLWYLSRRVFRAVLTLLGVVTIAFFLIRLNGNPAAMMLGPQATPETIATFNRAYGLDSSLPVQYLNYLGSMLRADFGDSITRSMPALDLVLSALPSTLVLAASAFAFGIIAAFLLSLTVQLTGSAKLRNLLLAYAAMALSLPSFLLGVLLILVFAITLQWLPAIGGGGIEYLILPMLTIGLYEAAVYIRLFNVAFGEQVSQDYVRTAKSKGQSRTVVLMRHMLPNGILPILTVAGINLGQLIGGTVIVETVFNRPGVGQLIYQAVTANDYPIVQVGLMIFALFFVIINLMVDLLYAVLDPRVSRS